MLNTIVSISKIQMVNPIVRCFLWNYEHFIQNYDQNDRGTTIPIIWCRNLNKMIVTLIEKPRVVILLPSESTWSINWKILLFKILEKHIFEMWYFLTGCQGLDTPGWVSFRSLLSFPYPHTEKSTFHFQLENNQRRNWTIFRGGRI